MELKNYKPVIGLDCTSSQWGDEKVFNVGYAYQQVTDWHKQQRA